MARYQITGPSVLSGEVVVGGSKNAVLPCLAATLLTDEDVHLENVPAIRDVESMCEILRTFGCETARTGNAVTVTGARHVHPVDDALTSRLRASILILGPLLGRFGRVEIAHPGGDIIGKRPIDMHFEGLRGLGATIEQTNSHYVVSAEKGLTGGEIFLEEASVTATENVMMAAVLASGRTVIRNAASELHVVDLAHFLSAMGAKIEGAGTNRITIDGVTSLHGATHRIRPDEIEAATLMIAAAVTGGSIVLKNTDPENMGIILTKLRHAGVSFSTEQDHISVQAPHRLMSTNIHTNVWPAFPTDLVSPFTILMTQATGMSLIHDWMYEGRFFYTDKLVLMGANIVMADPHRILVHGPSKLTAKNLESPDLRAGMTMVIAALIAEGTTTIEHVEHIERGYERIDERLKSLGARIERVE
jgi:UDP-N-acetylglucosamine 1-carboxyvinyltransferase